MPCRHTGEGEVQLYLFTTLVLHEGSWSMPHSSHFMPTNKTWYSLYRRMGGPQDWSGLVVEKTKSLVPTGVWTLNNLACSKSLSWAPKTILPSNNNDVSISVSLFHPYSHGLYIWMLFTELILSGTNMRVKVITYHAPVCITWHTSLSYSFMPENGNNTSNKDTV